MFKKYPVSSNSPFLTSFLGEGAPGGMAFQEYNPAYPHVKGSLGYAGRPGG